MIEMSKSEVLYVKGMDLSESDEDDKNAWDDRKLNEAYDKALKIANAEVARRVAMSTNTQNMSKENVKNKKGPPNLIPRPSKKKEIKWKAGMPCRCVYEGDGLEYEAFVLRIINDKECIVKYLGYDNSELVKINSLHATLGNQERTRQIEQAQREKPEADEIDNLAPLHHAEMEINDENPIPEGIDVSTFQRKKRTSKKKKHTNGRNFELPEMPSTMPNISMLRNFGSMEMPLPPPPMSFATSDRTDSEDQAISSMLLSWYMSGYYTGLYQGLKRAKENRRNN